MTGFHAGFLEFSYHDDAILAGRMPFRPLFIATTAVASSADAGGDSQRSLIGDAPRLFDASSRG